MFGTARRLALIVAVALVLAVLPVGLSGQGEQSSAPPKQPKITSLVTDRDDLTLSQNFGAVTMSSINQGGDLAFVSGVSNALFVRYAGSSAATSVLHMGDPAPGFAGTRCEIFHGLFINGPGDVAFSVEFLSVTGVVQRAIYVYDGSGFTRVAHSLENEPGQGGRAFGRDLQLVGIDDGGVVAFSAPLVPLLGGTQPYQTTLYLWAGGDPVRIAGSGDTAPGTGAGSGSDGTLDAIAGQMMSSAGEVLFTASVVRGNGGRGLFAASASKVRKVVSHGDRMPSPLTGTFDFSNALPAFRFNPLGQTAFVYGDHVFAEMESGLVLVVKRNDPVPAITGATFGVASVVPAFTVLAFNGPGQVVFAADVSGAGDQNFGLFRYTPADPPSSGLGAVAYRHTATPEANGTKFYNFPAASLNENGLLTFYGTGIYPGLSPRGFFQQSGPGAQPVKVVREGDLTPLSGGGSYGLALSGATVTLDNGAVLFSADVLGGSATAGTFLAEPNVLPGQAGFSFASLSSTEDPLPADSHPSLYTFGVGSGGDIVVFRAGRTGGQEGLWLYDLRTERTSQIMADGDPIPGMNGRLRNQTVSYMIVNAAGEVAFQARLIGVPGYGGVGIFLRTREGTLKKIVAQGDPDTPSGRTFSGISWNTTPSPLNDAGQVVFRATLAGQPGPNPTGVFVGAADTPPVKVVLSSDTPPAGAPGIYYSFGTATINNEGDVAFGARMTRNWSNDTSGVFVATPGATPVKIAASGDSLSSGSSFPSSMPGQFVFNDRGEVAFMSALDPTVDGGPDGGLFIGTATGSPIPVALNGDTAPSGGTFDGISGQPNFHLNNAGDVVFRTALAGDSEADSGLFLIRRADGVRRTIALQGQGAPGTGGTFDTIGRGLNGLVGENATLTPDGEVCTSQRVLVGADSVYTHFRFGKNNRLEKTFARGDKAPQSNGGTMANVIQVERVGVDASGLYYFWARIIGGKVSDAIYVTR